ncbi:MAG: stage V sporulation protein SpoVM [Oscillospiraceae bacterium]|nr:stage V sporulation protein SpoVM [Oscillospiraceae bacterium]
MKIITIDNPKFFGFLLRKIFGIKKDKSNDKKQN